MCRHDHEHEQGRGHHRGSGLRGSGFRGFGRGGFPPRAEWLERLQAHEQRLQEDLTNVQELIGRLAAPPAPSSEG